MVLLFKCDCKGVVGCSLKICRFFVITFSFVLGMHAVHYVFKVMRSSEDLLSDTECLLNVVSQG